jgi:hypothetical protein
MSRTHMFALALSVAVVAAVAVGLHPALALAGNATTTAAASTNPGQAGTQIETILQQLAGPLLIGLMAIRGLGHYMNHDYGKALGHFGLGALTAVPIYAGGPLTTAFTHVAQTLGQAL